MDGLKKGELIPSCELIERCHAEELTFLQHSVKIKGAKNPLTIKFSQFIEL